MLPGPGADGAPAGRFVLRNAFGPRVLRSGYTLAPGSSWWPSQVILDGVDITNVPTDFSAHENGRLEVFFTQHPARIAGTVIDADGQPVRAPWILVASADRALWQEWSTTSNVTQGNTTGQLLTRSTRLASISSAPSLRPRSTPGRPGDGTGKLGRHLKLASEGVPVEVEARKEATVTLTVKAP